MGQKQLLSGHMVLKKNPEKTGPGEDDQQPKTSLKGFLYKHRDNNCDWTIELNSVDLCNYAGLCTYAVV